MTASKVCVVVPFYNRAALVERALDSIAGQSVLPRQLVVVDDGSTDEGAHVVANWLKRHKSRLTAELVCQPNGGVSSARNRGLAHADDCKYVAFLDSDDYWPADFLARATKALDRAPSAIAATCDRLVMCGQGKTERHDLSELAAAPILWMLTHGAGLASASLFRLDAVRRLGGFDESLPTGEDTALFLPLALEGDWLHVPGNPVTFDRDSGGHGRVEANLSGKFRDNFRRWAKVYEQFIVHRGGSKSLSAADCRRVLGRVWYRAGRELARAGSFDEARDCYRASLAWNRWSVKTRHHLLRTYL